jgi:Contact-dependent growth inhibition CdiA C-terminal domain
MIADGPHPSHMDPDTPQSPAQPSLNRLRNNPGFDVEQNPPPKPNGKEPDYKIEGEYFDCYAPDSNKLDNVRDQISRKVKLGQADRIILNLDDSPRSMDEIKDVCSASR